MKQRGALRTQKTAKDLADLLSGGAQICFFLGECYIMWCLGQNSMGCLVEGFSFKLLFQVFSVVLIGIIMVCHSLCSDPYERP